MLLVCVRSYLKSVVRYRVVDKSLVRPGRKQARKHVRNARDFNYIETRAVIKFFCLQGKAPKEIHAILTETLACFLPGRAKDLSAPLYKFLILDIYCSHTLRLSEQGCESPLLFAKPKGAREQSV